MRLQLFFLSALTLSACGEDPPPDPLRNAAGFCSAWAEHVCTVDVVEGCSVASEDKCRATQKVSCLNQITDKTYTRTNAEGCLDAVTEALRDERVNPEEYRTLIEFGGACDDLRSGVGVTDDACKSDFDCDRVEGYECVKTTGKRDGSCQKPLRVKGGGKCTAVNAVCSEGQYCDGSHCIAKLEVGEKCSDTTPCSEELRCQETDTDGTTTCVQKLQNGAKDQDGKELLCSSNDECQTGLCDKVADTGMGRCANYVVLAANTEFCSHMR